MLPTLKLVYNVLDICTNLSEIISHLEQAYKVRRFKKKRRLSIFVEKWGQNEQLPNYFGTEVVEPPRVSWSEFNEENCKDKFRPPASANAIDTIFGYFICRLIYRLKSGLSSYNCVKQKKLFKSEPYSLRYYGHWSITKPENYNGRVSISQ
jgi:hypothetical protein